jgi:dTDP-glucose pyrophosphorylase
MECTMTNLPISRYTVSPEDPVQRAAEVLCDTRDGIVLVVDETGRLIGTISDGDIRRGLLKGLSLESKCHEVMWNRPITAPVGTDKETLAQKLQACRLRNIPLLDGDGRPMALADIRNFFGPAERPEVAVVMAGGEGQRLRPLTEAIPKPMVKVAGRPILEGIIEQLVDASFKQIYIAINYLGEIIEEYFGDGSQYGVEIHYLREEKKLGTAGALKLLPIKPDTSFLVMNGDVMTSVDFRAFSAFHREHRAALTVGACQYNFQIPLGVLKTAGSYIVGLEEKPVIKHLCSAGIYMLDPETLSLVHEKEAYNMTELIEDVSRKGLPVSAFPIHEYWLDIGQKDDLMRARKEQEPEEDLIAAK